MIEPIKMNLLVIFNDVFLQQFLFCTSMLMIVETPYPIVRKVQNGKCR